MNGLGSQLVSARKRLMAACRSATDLKTPPLRCCLGSLAKRPLKRWRPTKLRAHRGRPGGRHEHLEQLGGIRRDLPAHARGAPRTRTRQVGAKGAPPVHGRPQLPGPRLEGSGKRAREPIVDLENSAALRDQLVHEIAGLDCAEGAAEWAR